MDTANNDAAAETQAYGNQWSVPRKSSVYKRRQNSAAGISNTNKYSLLDNLTQNALSDDTIDNQSNAEVNSNKQAAHQEKISEFHQFIANITRLRHLSQTLKQKQTSQIFTLIITTQTSRSYIPTILRTMKTRKHFY